MLTLLAKNKRGVLLGVVLAVIIALLDMSIRVLDSESPNSVVFNTDAQQALSINDTTYLSDEGFQRAFGWLIELRQQRLAAEQAKKRRAAEQKSRAAQGATAGNVSKPAVESAPQNYQITAGDWQLTLKGIFFADTYFAVVIQQQGNKPPQTTKLQLNERVGPFVVQNITETTLTLGDNNNNQQHVLKLFKQD